MQPVMLIVVIIPKIIAIQIQIVVDVLCSTDELSENVVYLVSAVVIPLVFDVDELCEKTSDQLVA